MRHMTAGPGGGGMRVLCVAAVLASVGCVTRTGVYDDIYRNRNAAYQAWKSAKEGREGAQLVLTGKLSVQKAVKTAWENNKLLGTIREQRENAKGRIIEAYSAALPKLDFRGGYTRLDKVPTFKAGGVSVPMGNRNNYSGSLVLTQPFFRGGAIAAGIRGANIFAFLTDEEVAKVQQDVVYQTRLTYYDSLLARELVKVSEGDVKLAKAHLGDVQKKKAAGVVSQYDVLRARVEVSNVEAQLIERQNASHLAMTTLLKTMGVSQESRVELTDKLEYKAALPVIEQAVKKAFHERPEILKAELAVKLNQELVVDARSGFLPRVEGTYTRTRAKPDPHNQARQDWGNEWSAAMTMIWPIFDGLASVGRMRQARADLQRSVIELAEAEEQVLLDVKQALFSIEDAEKFVKSQSDNRKRAEEGLRLAKAGYDAGVNTEIEMLDARQALSETHALYYQAVYRHQTAKLALERATGALKNPKGIGGPNK